MRSRLPLCGDPCFGFRSPGPGAEKDIEKQSGTILCKAGLPHRGPEAGAPGVHGPQEQTLGCSADRRSLAMGLWWGGGSREAGPGSTHGSDWGP